MQSIKDDIEAVHPALQFDELAEAKSTGRCHYELHDGNDCYAVTIEHIPSRSGENYAAYVALGRPVTDA